MLTKQNKRKPVIDTICYEEPMESWCVTFIPGEDISTTEDKMTIFINKDHSFYDNINDIISQTSKVLKSKKHISTIIKGSNDFFTICFDDCSYKEDESKPISRLMSELAYFAERDLLEYYNEKNKKS